MTHCRKLFREALRPMTTKAQKNGCMQRTTPAVVRLNFWLSWSKKPDKNASFLFNQYFRDSSIDADKWFAAKPLSNRTFASFLGEICTAARVQKKYTPHCLRATAVTYLNYSGFEARHIMFMSNHKNKSSLRSYNRSMSSNQKKSLSKTLSSMASASRSPTPRVQNENTALLPIPVLANVNMPPPIPQNVELTFNVVNTQEINPNAGFFNNSSFSNCTFNFTVTIWSTGTS